MTKIWAQIAELSRWISILEASNWKKPLPRFKSLLRLILIGCVAFLSSVILSGLPVSFSIPVEAIASIQTPLSTQGARIVDATGKPILLRGVNWFGMETDVHVPHGLWVRDYKEMLAQIKKLGYNIIRLPYSVNAIRSTNISGVDFSIGSNRDLQGKTPIQVMDIIIQEAAKQSLFILLDSHRLNDANIPELWYGDGFTEADWINTWVNLANRYKNQANVIGADLKNEPHGQASWGTGDRNTDWRLAAERAGNAILAANPKWLIVVEGVEKNVPGQQLNHWWGGNLEGVKSYPVRLSVKNKVVYSPHEYGQGVADQPWFHTADFPNNLYSRWEKGFNYIATQNIAPIFIGEFGGRNVDSSSKEGIWQRQFINFIGQKNLSFTYWSWNPNSGDTGGILLDDWRNIRTDKQQLLNPLLNQAGIATPQPTKTPTSTPTKTPSTTPTPKPSPLPSKPPTPTSTKLQAIAIVSSDWDKGFCVNFKVTNQGSTIKNWQLKFVMQQAVINNSWNGVYANQGSQYTVTVPDWAKVLQSGQSIDSVGFCANKQGSNYKPQQVKAIAL